MAPVTYATAYAYGRRAAEPRMLRISRQGTPSENFELGALSSVRRFLDHFSDNDSNRRLGNCLTTSWHWNVG